MKTRLKKTSDLGFYYLYIDGNPSGSVSRNEYTGRWAATYGRMCTDGFRTRRDAVEELVKWRSQRIGLSAK